VFPFLTAGEYGLAAAATGADRPGSDQKMAVADADQSSGMKKAWESNEIEGLRMGNDLLL
jgi:hypothetical protein